MPASAVEPLATFNGSVVAPHGAGWVDLQVATPADRVLLAFECTATDGSALRPGPVRLFANGGGSVAAPRLGTINGFSLKVVSDGMYFARAAGARATTGDFEMSVRLAGDVNGDRQVDALDLDVIRTLQGVRARDDGFVAEADVNHNGKIGIRDLALARWNVGRSAEVGPITADQFLFSGSNMRGPQSSIQYNPTTMSGISLVIPSLFDGTIVPIDAIGFSWQVQLEASGGASRAVMTNLLLAANTSKASPKLFEAVVWGQILPEASLFAGQASKNVPKLRWDMTAVRITSYSAEGTENGTVVSLRDTIALTFDTLRITFTPTRPDGTPGVPVSFGWDFVSNQPW